MGYGVLAIFLVIMILIAIVYVLHAAEMKDEVNKADPNHVPLSEKAKQKAAAAGEYFKGMFKRGKAPKKSKDDDNGETL